MIRIIQEDTPLNPPVFSTVIPVRWGDMDAEGHVNNTGFFRFMEETRMRWVAGLGLPTQPPHPVIVLLNAACHYLKPLGYPSSVEVALHAGRIGRSSAQTHYLMRHVEAGTPCAEGYATLVWYDLQQQKSVPLPDTLRAALAVTSA
ncbi:MAG: thioesterase family protein [Burkholderiales bacterium]|nr:thioesterase family protein [Burkholderiales bacterium]MDP3715385.1 thioesterase family protein [Burkholderiales bacterium]